MLQMPIRPRGREIASQPTPNSSAAISGPPVSGRLGLLGRIEDHSILDAGGRRPPVGRLMVHETAAVADHSQCPG